MSIPIRERSTDGVKRLRKKRRLGEAYKSVFSTNSGRIVLADLMIHCGASMQSHIPGCPDETSFNEGKRRVWLHINDYLYKTDEEIQQQVRTENV